MEPPLVRWAAMVMAPVERRRGTESSTTRSPKPQHGKGAAVTDEARRVLRWLLDRKIPAEFNGHIPPDTDAKNEVADATADTIESNVSGLYVEASGPFRFKLVTVEEVRESVINLFEADADMNRPKADAITSSAMEDCGCRRITPASTANRKCTSPAHATRAGYGASAKTTCRHSSG